MVSPAASALLIVSTVAGDSIVLAGGSGAGQVSVTASTIPTTSFSPTEFVIVSGSGGSDTYTVNFGSTLTTPIFLAGGGSAGDTLVVNGDGSATNVIKVKATGGNGARGGDGNTVTAGNGGDVLPPP